MADARVRVRVRVRVGVRVRSVPRMVANDFDGNAFTQPARAVICTAIYPSERTVSNQIVYLVPRGALDRMRVRVTAMVGG